MSIPPPLTRRREISISLSAMTSHSRSHETQKPSSQVVSASASTTMSPPAASFGLGRADNNASASIAPMDSSTPWMAASDGNLTLLQSSLAALNISPSAADENGYTLLHAASSYGQLPIMKFLLTTHHVPVNAVDHDGDSALHHAERVDAAKLLVEHGANPQLRNHADKTPLQAKQEELDEQMQDEDDEDEEEVETLRAMIEYLSSLSS